jgi:hypothetical protein
VSALALRIGRCFLAAGLIIGGTGVSAPAATQEDVVPTFGTTVVVPGGLRGVIYPISPLSRFLPFFQSLEPLGVIYTSALNVTPRDYREGFPGITDRNEWFAIDYSGRFWIEKPGLYRFELTSDDGSRLYIDDDLVLNNDGIHALATQSAALTLAGGIHRIHVPYFQGPGEALALVLRVAGPGEDWRIFSTEEFKPPSNPATWTYLGQVFRVSSVAGAPGQEVTLEISLDSAAARAPTALRWDVVFPAELLELEGDGPDPGDAARESGKSLACTARKPYSCACSLAGGRNPVANGPIAIFHFRIRNTADTGTAAVRVERAEAVTAGSKKMALSNAEGTVTIRQR